MTNKRRCYGSRKRSEALTRLKLFVGQLSSFAVRLDINQRANVLATLMCSNKAIDKSVAATEPSTMREIHRIRRSISRVPFASRGIFRTVSQLQDRVTRVCCQ
jgi:hypothetical protein